MLLCEYWLSSTKTVSSLGLCWLTAAAADVVVAVSSAEVAGVDAVFAAGAEVRQCVCSRLEDRFLKEFAFYYIEIVLLKAPILVPTLESEKFSTILEKIQ